MTKGPLCRIGISTSLSLRNTQAGKSEEDEHWVGGLAGDHRAPDRSAHSPRITRPPLHHHHPCDKIRCHREDHGEPTIPPAPNSLTRLRIKSTARPARIRRPPVSGSDHEHQTASVTRFAARSATPAGMPHRNRLRGRVVMRPDIDLDRSSQDDAYPGLAHSDPPTGHSAARRIGAADTAIPQSPVRDPGAHSPSRVRTETVRSASPKCREVAPITPSRIR